MSNSPLISLTKISPNKISPRTHEIDTITIHVIVGQWSIETIGNYFAQSSVKASPNYGIGYDGKIVMCVEEGDRSWCSSSWTNDDRAITIECASDTKHPYTINAQVYASLIELCADICKRNNIKELKWEADKSLIGQPDKQNLTVHRWFANKACPGEYIYSRLGKIAAEVNARLNEKIEPGTETIYRVQTGAFRNKEYADAMYNKVKAAGFDTYMVKYNGLYKVQVGAYKKEANAKNMAAKLEKAGFESYITTVGGEAAKVSARKTIDELAREVIDGKWGNGTDRKNRLTKAGYDASAVQARVNELV